MKPWLIVGAVVVVVVVVAALVAARVVFSGPDLSAYERFREPAVVTLPAVKVLQVEATGVPAETSQKAFSALFSVYFKLDGVPKGPKMPAPRGRWSGSFDAPAQLVGRFAIPVPETVTAVPKTDAAPSPALAQWEYGEVAQILHVGPYSAETPTIERLRAFISAQKLELAGDHEEEYLRGPGMFGPGNPAEYYTLIRYQVRPAAK